MHVVRNLTKRTIILSDLRAEIGPYKMLDLEKVASREAVLGSADLRTALKSARLRLMSKSVVNKKPEKEIRVIERVIEKHIEKPSEDGIDEAKLEAMMKRILEEQEKPVAPQDNTNVILKAVAALQEQIGNIKAGEDDSLLDMPNIDPALFADLQSKAIEKISKTIETGVKKSPKKVKLKNTRSTDLANELD